MIDEGWAWATVAVVAGLVIGAVAGVVTRRVLSREGRRPALREASRPASLFVFWLAAAAGIVLAVGVSSPETLRPIPRDILDWLPNVAVAGVFLIGGYVVAMTLSLAVGRAVQRVAGVRQQSIERLVLSAVLVGAVILALGQIGVDTTILNILIAGAWFGMTAATAGLTVVGGQRVASHVAAGRALRSRLQPGTRISAGELSGSVVEVHTVHVLIEDQSGVSRLIPYARLIDEVITIEEG
ncbi:MAG: hypothetical protein H0T70_06890 [Acidimicrobiia bacterium]|nr:hypothetical protein [Acidimicrobiia bacterium]